MAVSQKEFISFVALPLFDLMAKLSDGQPSTFTVLFVFFSFDTDLFHHFCWKREAFHPLLEHLRSNLKTWTDKATQARPPSPESPMKPKVDPKLQRALSNRRKSLPAAQFLLRNLSSLSKEVQVSE